MTADSGELNEKMDPDQLLSPIKRLAGNAANSISDIFHNHNTNTGGVFQNHNANTGGMFGDEGPYRPDDPALYDPTSFDDSLKNSIQQASETFVNEFYTAMFGPT